MQGKSVENMKRRIRATLANLKATLKFPSLELAERFGLEWTRHTLSGRDRSSVSEDGSVKVTVYHVNEERKSWIENWVKANG